MTNYARANRKPQWFASTYPGSQMKPNVVVLHTTEGLDWDGYSGGSIAPNYTAKPDMRAKKMLWRAHFPDEMSSRALVNAPGGVETNTLNCVQVELIGTCDPAHAKTWSGLKAGVDYIYWPEAPAWALHEVAAFLADQHKRHGLKLQAPKKWLPYPASYGASKARLTGKQWSNFYGVCGHQHVPENDHGDPGALPITAILEVAQTLVNGPAPVPVPAPTPKPTTTPAHSTKTPAIVTRGANIDHAIADLTDSPRWRAKAARRLLLAIPTQKG